MGIISFIERQIPKNVRKIIRHKKSKKIFLNGYNNFLKTGTTSQEAYMSLIDLYCASNGKFNEEFNDQLKLIHPSVAVANELTGVIGKYSTTDFTKVNEELNQNGYSHFDKKLSKELCDKLYNFALQTPAKIPPSYDKKIQYDPEKPLAEIYRFDIQDMVNNTDIQQLMMDPVLLNIARNYLGCEPIFDFPAMWWSTAYKKDPSSEAAQLYHFDMDRVKWLKIFFFINDVTLENGPHCYIQGTHKLGAKPQNILERGYVRVSDEELLPYYKQTDVKVVCGEAGAVFAGDTKCWHKGTNLKKGHRLVLEFEYTSSLFGSNIPKMEIENYTEEFKSFCASHKVFASNIHFKSK